LKIESQARDDHQVKLIVEFEPEALEEAKHRAARKMAGRMKIPGFRPGKAPYVVVLRQVGEAGLFEEAAEILIDEKYTSIIEEAGIKPYSAGQLENIPSKDPLIMEFVVPLEPEVVLGDYRALRRPYERKEISDAEVNEMLESLRDRQAILEPAERPAGEGDVVSAKLSAVRLNPEEDQNSELIEERSNQFLVHASNAEHTDEWPFPGFSQELVGLSSGEEKTIVHLFGEDYLYESLRGVEASYHVAIEEVKSRQLPELNDDFAKTIGEYADLEALRTDIHLSLEQQSLESYHEIYDDAIIDELIEESTIKYPPQMLESEQNTVVDNFKQRLEQQGTDLELYLKTRGIDEEGLKQEAQPVAEKRLQRSLVLLEISKVENIQVSEEDLQAETMRTLNMLNRSLPPEEARRLTNERIMNNLVGNIMLDLLTRRAQLRLRDIAKGSFVPEEETAEEAPVEAAPEAPAEIETTANEIVSTAVEATIQDHDE
jgi:trigger factor